MPLYHRTSAFKLLEGKSVVVTLSPKILFSRHSLIMPAPITFEPSHLGASLLRIDLAYIISPCFLLC